METLLSGLAIFFGVFVCAVSLVILRIAARPGLPEGEVFGWMLTAVLRMISLLVFATVLLLAEKFAPLLRKDSGRAMMIFAALLFSGLLLDLIIVMGMIRKKT